LLHASKPVTHSSGCRHFMKKDEPRIKLLVFSSQSSREHGREREKSQTIKLPSRAGIILAIT
jgi:hypothetical protein